MTLVSKVAPPTEDVKSAILDAAQARFRQYGYRKTTMGEIAEDASMSAANLYRYFESKLDIAAACAMRCIDERNRKLHEIVLVPDLAASERLGAFALGVLHHTREFASSQPRTSELVQTILEERPEVVGYKVDSERGLIAKVLALGNASGEFEIENTREASTAVHTALIVFGIPLFMGLTDGDAYERRADEVVRLLVRGLAKR